MKDSLKTVCLALVIAASCLFVSISASEATYLNNVTVSYDPLDSDWLKENYGYKDFVCEYYTSLCTIFLDGIGCDSSYRSNVGCNPTVQEFSGTCKCTGSPVYMDLGSQISTQIVDNRIKNDVPWMLEPWASGPPYSARASYPAICELFLHRIQCPAANQSIAVGSNDGTKAWTCACGAFTAGSARLEQLICDYLTAAKLSVLPVFDEPFTFSVEFSIAIVMIVGKIGSIIATAIHLPAIIGFILAGVLIQDIINPSLISGAGGTGPHATPFGEIRVFALIVVLMRAGLTAKPQELFSRGYMTVVLSILPYFSEFFVMLGYGTTILPGWSLIDIGLLASILAALSPSLVIPGMIKLVSEHVGFAPRTVLISAPIEVVLAIILYGIFASLEQTSPSTQFPWVKVLPLYANILLIPVTIIFSSVLGIIAGYVVLKYIEFRQRLDTWEGETAVVKGMLVDMRRWAPAKSIGEYTFAAITACYTLYSICVNYYIPYTSGVLAVFAMTIFLNGYLDPAVTEQLRQALAGLWVFLEVFLFTTTGINLSFKSVTGPLQSDRGVNSSSVKNLMALFFIGSLGRVTGILLTGVLGTYFSLPHRRSFAYLIPWVIATWTFQWPKATVQATLGVLPFQNHVIPGSAGLTKGLFILQAAAFAILVQAPIGVFLTSVIGRPLAVYLREMDRQHGETTDENVLDGLTLQPVKEIEMTAAGAKGADDEDKGDDLEDAPRLPEGVIVGYAPVNNNSTTTGTV